MDAEAGLEESNKIMQRFNNYFKRELDNNLKVSRRVQQDAQGDPFTPAGFQHEDEFEENTGINIEDIIHDSVLNQNESPLDKGNAEAIK